MLRPKPCQIVPAVFWPFLTLSLFSGLAGQLVLALKPEAFLSHYFRNTTVLLAVHLTTIGFLMILFLTVLTQAVSVLFHKHHASVSLSVTGLLVFLSGATALFILMGGAARTWLPYLASLGITGGLFILLGQAFNITRGGGPVSLAWSFLSASLFYLVVTVTLGLSMAFGLIKPVWSDPLKTIHLHLHLGLYGFATLAIFGMSTKLLRLFQYAVAYRNWPLKTSFLFIHAGLALVFLRWIGAVRFDLLVVSGWLFGGGVLFYIIQLYLLLAVAKNRRFDSSLITQLVALFFLIVAVVMENFLNYQAGGGSYQAQEACLYLGLAGWIGGFIHGQLQKIVGVLSWFDRFWIISQSMKVPVARSLPDPTLSWTVPLLHSAATASGFFGLFYGWPRWISTAGWLGAGCMLCTMGLALSSRLRGKTEPFPETVAA